MAPHLRRSAASTTLNARAARLALDQRKKREERAHVTDVIGGWGPPGSLPDEESEQIRLNHLDNEKRGFLENDRKEWEKEGGTKGYEKKLRKVAQRGGECFGEKRENRKFSMLLDVFSFEGFFLLCSEKRHDLSLRSFHAHDR